MTQLNPARLRPAAKARDDFSHSARKTIAARVGWRCSNPDCRALTTGPVSDQNRASVIGIAAHITAAAKGGPRFDARLSACERRSATNGIWLCAACAKAIDDDTQFYSASVLRFWRIDAEQLAGEEKGRPAGSTAALRFAAIGVDPRCMWRPSHRLGKVAAQIGARPQIGFHVLPQQAWEGLGVSPSTHSLDPVFDLTLVNDAERTSVLSAIGFEVLQVWSDLKGLSQPHKVKIIEGYTLQVAPIVIGTAQMIPLPDPIAVPAAHPVRLCLALAGFRPRLRGNESLMRLLVCAAGASYRSRLINLGVY